MKNRTIIIMLFVAAAFFFIFAAAVEAQGECQLCTANELETGNCSQLRDGYGNFTGYIVRSSFDSENGITKISYSICVQDGYAYTLDDMNSVAVELPICTKSIGTQDETPIHCTVTDASDRYEVHLNGAGDPSKGFLKWFPSDLFKIKREVQSFWFKVSSDAYKTLGNIGIKAGKAMLIGKISTPVCDESCGLTTYAAVSSGAGAEPDPVIVETETGYKFELLCDGSTGCCKATRCMNPAGVWKTCESEEFGEFFKTTKGEDPQDTEDVTDMSSGDVCLNIVVNDTSKTSPSYCSGGWCWYF